MCCKLTFDAVSGYFASFVFAFLVTLGVSFLSDWKVWYISLITALSFLGILYCVWLVYHKSPWLIIDANGISFKNKPWSFTKLKFISWASVASYYNYTYPFDYYMRPEYLVLVCTGGKKLKITISGLDRSEDEILGMVRKYYSSIRDVKGGCS